MSTAEPITILGPDEEPLAVDDLRPVRRPILFRPDGKPLHPERLGWGELTGDQKIELPFLINHHLDMGEVDPQDYQKKEFTLDATKGHRLVFHARQFKDGIGFILYNAQCQPGKKVKELQDVAMRLGLPITNPTRYRDSDIQMFYYEGEGGLTA